MNHTAWHNYVVNDDIDIYSIICSIQSYAKEVELIHEY